MLRLAADQLGPWLSHGSVLLSAVNCSTSSLVPNKAMLGIFAVGGAPALALAWKFVLQSC